MGSDDPNNAFVLLEGDKDLASFERKTIYLSSVNVSFQYPFLTIVPHFARNSKSVIAIISHHPFPTTIPNGSTPVEGEDSCGSNAKILAVEGGISNGWKSVAAVNLRGTS